jgi:hypothetical protein
MPDRLTYAEDAGGRGIRGLLPYRSTFNARARGDTRDALAAQRVYRFKKSGESAAVWQRLIEAAREDLGCAAVWTVPGHDPNATSRLQELFGVTIRRARTVPPRKYGHHAPVDLGSFDFPPPPATGGRVLLVDDVATTGGTLAAIREHLAGQNVEAVPLALGLNARLLPKGFDPAPLTAQWEREASAARAPHFADKADARHAARTGGRMIERREPESLSRRRRLENDPAAWLRFYLGPTFPLPFGDVHRRMIEAAVRAIRTGAGMCVAAPRGTGKSSVLWGVALWAILSGACRFPVVAAWAHGAARRMLRRWLSALADNARIRADYRETCAPFEETTHPVRLRLLRWKDTGELCGADVRIMDGALVLPAGRGAVGAASVGGNTRGLFATMPSGETLRPDVLFLDDPQDKPTAESPALVRKTVERIESDLFNLAGPETRLSIMAAVTVIAEGDVAERFLSHADFEAIRCGQVVTWPAGFDDKASEARRLWEAWNIERVEGMADHDGGKRARAFYAAHKPALTAGLSVSWEHRLDRKRGDPDACFAALWDFYRLGEAAFMAERQNAPLKENPTVYDLTPELVASRMHPGRRRCDVPAEARLLIAATDLNFYGLHSAVAGFGNDGTAWLVAYGRHDGDGREIVPKDTPEPEAKRRMFEALVKHGHELAGLPLLRNGQSFRPALWVVDAGFMPDVVRRFAEGPGRTMGVPIMPARGFNFDKYRPTPKNCIGHPREQCHLTESPVAGRFLAFNSCFWREVSQRAWLAMPNAPGSLSLFEGRHVEIAEHVTRERLIEKLQGQFGTVWRWRTAPGWHDYGDAVTMCYVGAAWGGIGTGGAMPAPVRRRYVERRKCRVSFIEI